MPPGGSQPRRRGDEDQQERREQRRHRQEHERRPAHERRGGAAAAAGEDAERNAEQRRGGQRDERQHRGVGRGAADETANRAVVEKRVAEVEPQRRGRPRAPTAPPGCDRGRSARASRAISLGRGEGAELRRDVARRQPRQQQRGRRDDDHEHRAKSSRRSEKSSHVRRRGSRLQRERGRLRSSDLMASRSDCPRSTAPAAAAPTARRRPAARCARSTSAAPRSRAPAGSRRRSAAPSLNSMLAPRPGSSVAACSSISVSMRRSHSVAGVFCAMFQKCARARAEPEVQVAGRIEIRDQRTACTSRRSRTPAAAASARRTRAARCRARCRRCASSSRSTAVPRSYQPMPRCVITVKRASVPFASSTTPLPLRSSRPMLVQQRLAPSSSSYGYRGTLGENQLRVARRDRSPDRHRRAEEHRLRKRLAIHRVRDRLPELGPLHEREARILPFTSGLRQNQKASASGPTPSSISEAALPPPRAAPARSRPGAARSASGRCRPTAGAAARRSGRARSPGRGDRDTAARRRRRLAPVARVAVEDEALARLVLAQHERARADDLRRRRAGVPRRRRTCRRRARLRACASAGSAGRRAAAGRGPRAPAKVKTTVCGSGAAARSGWPPAVRLLGEDALDLRIEDRLQREEHVGGGERRAVGPRARPGAGGACGCGRPALDSHVSASQGSSSKVARLMRTSRPCSSRLRSSVVWSRGDVAVEGARLAPDRGDDLAAAGGGRRRRGSPRRRPS